MRDNFAQKAALTFKVKVLRSLELVSEDVDHGDSLLVGRVLDHKLIWYAGDIVICCLRLTLGSKIVHRVVIGAFYGEF